MRVTFHTADGVEVELTADQTIALADRLDEFDDPVWHVNACGCCVSVHNRDDGHRGYVIGRDGEADWVERPE